MKAIVVLFAADLSTHAYEKKFNGSSAFDRAVQWAHSVPHTVKTVVISQKDTKQKWTVGELLEHIYTQVCETQADFVVYAWGDVPFYNQQLTTKLIEQHIEYRGEYTFADAYPYGFAPEIIHGQTILLLSELAKTKPEQAQKIVGKNSLFELLETDINSFEIETLVAPEDFRYLRLQFSCDTKRNTLACERLYQSIIKKNSALIDNSLDSSLDNGMDTAYELSLFAQKSAYIQRTLPAFYAIQICNNSPLKSTANFDFMDSEHFKKLIDTIADFSEDAVISLSFLSEPLYHPQFSEFATHVLAHSNLSLLIETDGLLVTDTMAGCIKAPIGNNEYRLSGQRAVNWIIRLDASDEAVYKKLHGEKGSLLQAETAVALLKPLFPDAVYPQMERRLENEEQLEQFFRRWTAEGQVIIQKYDHISHFLPDLRPADLSPAKRFPCWHIKRDVCVLVDGRVPRCKAAVFATHTDKKAKNPLAFLGNVFEEPLSIVWERGLSNLEYQIQEKYLGQCGVSDEYYTFNF